MVVLKFGGTSVQNAQMMDVTISIAERQLDRAPVLVASAMSKVTDQLQEIAKLVGAGKELAVLLSGNYNQLKAILGRLK